MISRASFFRMIKFVESNLPSDPEAAARKLIKIANGVETVQNGRIHIEKVNGPFLFQIKGTRPLSSPPGSSTR